jgi:hypothetical protein
MEAAEARASAWAGAQRSDAARVAAHSSAREAKARDMGKDREVERAAGAGCGRRLIITKL